MMRHPLEFIPLNLRKPMFYFFLALTVLIFWIFSVLDEPLRNEISPNGIVSLELAMTPYRAYEIFKSWDLASGGYLSGNPILGIHVFYRIDHYLFFGLGFDYLFMPVYALALSLGLLLASHEKPEWLRSYAAWVGWGVFAAAIFDAVENYALWKILTGTIVTPFPQIAGVCATVKFTLLILGITVAVVSTFSRKEPPFPTSPE